MDEELKAYLDVKFGEVQSEFGKVQSEFGNVQSEFGNVQIQFGNVQIQFEKVQSQFEKVQSQFGEVRSQFGEVRSELLSEFWKWGRVSDQRVRRVEHSDATTIERLAAMEDRLFTLERKVAGSKEQ
jgi:DNA anti-recombination protein RmuC